MSYTDLMEKLGLEAVADLNEALLVEMENEYRAQKSEERKAKSKR